MLETNSVTMEEENIQVVVRIRPMMLSEKKAGEFPIVEVGSNGKEVQVKVGPLNAQSYRCNRCFPNDTTQFQFFHESGIADLLDSSIDGYRTCAFAFGQTGAGKTFTMMGSSVAKSAIGGRDSGLHYRDRQNMGMVGRSLEYIFAKLEAMAVTKYSIKISCLEIYQEHVFDLFAEEKERLPLQVREHTVEGFYLDGCKMIECTNLDSGVMLIENAIRNRQTGGHDLNNRSSRSHCLTDIFIEVPAMRTDLPLNDSISGFVVKGRISLVDLAGSERLKQTNSTGKVLQEAGFINRSLYVLGKVIAGLVRTNGDLNHKDVPYRDSKLTKLLIASLCGRSRTLLISCVSEAKGSQAETLRTLKFSMSCARIKNKPMKFLDPHEKIVIELKDEIRRLRHENQKLRSNIASAPAATGGEKPLKVESFAENVDSKPPQYPPQYPSQVGQRATSAEGSLLVVKQRKKQQAIKRQQQQMSPEEIQEQQQLLQSKIRQEIQQMKSKLAVNKRPKPGKANSKSNSPAKMKAKSKDGGFFRKHLEEKLRMQDLPVETEYDTYEEDEEEGDYDYEDRSSENSATTSKKHLSKHQLEDIIRRRAVGPMVFKSPEKTILPVMETVQSQSVIGDSQYKEIFATKQGKEKENKYNSKSHKPPRPNARGANASAWSEESAAKVENISLEEYLVGPNEGKLTKKAEVKTSETLPEKSKKKNDEEEYTYVKPKKKISPYIAHTANNKELVEAKKKLIKYRDEKEKNSKVSSKDHGGQEENSRPAVLVIPSVEGDLSARRSKKKVPQETRVRVHKRQMEEESDDSYEASFADDNITRERFLPDLNTHQSNSKGVMDGRRGSVVPSSLPAIVEDGADSDSYSDIGVTLISSGAQIQSNMQSKNSSSSIPVLPNIQEKMPAKATGMAKSNDSRSDNAPMVSVSDIRSKLRVLEKSLAAEKVEMEDNPGLVTGDTEELLSTLEREAKSMRQELDITVNMFTSTAGSTEARDDDESQHSEDERDRDLEKKEEEADIVGVALESQHCEDERDRDLVKKEEEEADIVGVALSDPKNNSSSETSGDDMSSDKKLSAELTPATTEGSISVSASQKSSLSQKSITEVESLMKGTGSESLFAETFYSDLTDDTCRSVDNRVAEIANDTVNMSSQVLKATTATRSMDAESEYYNDVDFEGGDSESVALHNNNNNLARYEDAPSAIVVPVEDDPIIPAVVAEPPKVSIPPDAVSVKGSSSHDQEEDRYMDDNFSHDMDSNSEDDINRDQQLLNASMTDKQPSIHDPPKHINQLESDLNEVTHSGNERHGRNHSHHDAGHDDYGDEDFDE